MTPSTNSPEPSPVVHRGWSVTFAGLGINLALGVLYTWSMFKEAIKSEFVNGQSGWKADQLNDPYALCCLVFAFAMIIAGRCQDKLGPRLTALIGGLLVGAGMVCISFTSSYTVWLLGFGLLVGLGLGFGYSSATPPALKWFPPSKTGMIAGLVVSGFGLAPVYLAPLSKYLLTHYKLQGSMLIFGIAFTVIVCGLAQFLVNPPAGYSAAPASGAASANKPAAANASPMDLFRSPLFYLLWFIYFIGSGAGLMVISSISGMAKKSMGEMAFLAVAIMAVGNAGGRITAGTLSDKIGRRWTLFIVLAFQAALMFAAIPITASKSSPAAVIVILAALVGANYGANLSLFPSMTKDLWGLKSFGINYGILFTAWGVGGFILSRVQQMLTASSAGSYQSSFITAGVLLLIGGGLTFLIGPTHRTHHVTAASEVPVAVDPAMD
ncbi:major facilitator superfamily MFS_1 [Chthoniobacter flavus Ellin428]|uniref:Major facilitator superfamily MFS_1 n=1 Tax=Chthoniobacter flavus Ellin428 TaxID=497964 RepID=B4CVZ0_9BACT|nr:OFA family MFS transporter [Chthoniobacter flavus]EDY21582.1 major facilitator superfamily MFS_1 [Chthoniobacter flavus Ellin428]TCO95525.1 nitrate/nitrite transporter NarK [Chthoniobacter flavus]